MARAWLFPSLLLALAASCLLPEISTDPELDDPEIGGSNSTKVLPELPDAAGSGGAGNAAGAAAGSSGMPSAGSGGSGGVVVPPVTPSTGGMGGGTGGTMATAGAGGGAGTGGAAGTGGSGMRTPLAECGDIDREQACADYCTNYEQSCGDFPDAYTYENVGDCAQTCYDSAWPVGTISEKGSILCRCYHSTLALNNGVTPHCFHAAEVPSMANGCAP